MSQDDILGIVRHVLTTAGGSLVTSGLLTGGQLQDAVGALVVLTGVAWSLLNKRQVRTALAIAKGPTA